jgi:hypothetical protein
MRRAQIVGEVFIYTMAAVIFGLILLFGYKAVNNFVKQSNNVALLELRQQVQGAVSSIGASPDVEKKVLNVPTKYRKVCFLGNTTLIEKGRSCICKNCKGVPGAPCCYGINESDYSPFICNAWKTGTKQNVFLVPSADIEIVVGKISFEPDVPNPSINPGLAYPIQYLCVGQTKGKITLKLRGMGDSTRISEWR